MTKPLLTMLFLFIAQISFSQNVDMADSFRADGKIYIVVATVAILLAGIIFYLFRTEQRLDKIEKSLNK